MSEREAKILNIIVEYYIKKGEPVGSSFLASHYSEKGKFLSSATIRNIFKKMEEKELIEKTHLSSGRIPTKKGLKVYLENLINDFKSKGDKIDKSFTQKINILAGRDLISNLETYAEILEKETGVVSLLLLPDLFTTKIKRIDFVQLSPEKILAIIVSVNDFYRETILEMPYPVNYQQLIAAANYINMNFSGLTLFEIKKRLLNSIESGLNQLNNVAKNIVKLAYENIDRIYGEENSIIIKGLSNILDERYVKEVRVLKSLMENFEKKKDIYHLITSCINKELAFNLDFPAENFSLIVSSYSVVGGGKGAFGLVGPLRMNYKRNISIMRQITHSIIEQLFVK
ncbi:heat-inducible transcriptional repressor HrcA [Thermotomaculum hydrothermale]|uniref:heat-inducible transcriptional repressor HrcA n=1 Tax=Thermotomaculum hydrothermale TaxID=981385 RepID=UPI001915F2DA|nr:heat-inducible transcriptional repressor HrcA [Thermotomaculum hydrothermale]